MNGLGRTIQKTIQKAEEESGVSDIKKKEWNKSDKDGRYVVGKGEQLFPRNAKEIVPKQNVLHQDRKMADVVCD